MAQRVLRCFAYGDNGHWEAFCIDLNLAVEGRSLEEVRASLSEMICTYIEDVEKEEPADRAQLLQRCAPFSILARYYLGLLFSVFRRGDDRRRQTNFELPCRV